MNRNMIGLLALAPASMANAANVGLGGHTPTQLNVERTSYTGGRGSRSIATADTVLAMAQDTKLFLSLSGGERRVAGASTRSVRGSGAWTQQWTDHLSTTASASVASNSAVWARSQFGLDVRYEIVDGLVAAVGGKRAAYGGGDNVTTWSAGAAYYGRGFSLDYRYSALDSARLGWSHAHLASARISDPHGAGSTQLWFGAGSSLYDVVTASQPRNGNFTSLALRRVQPVRGPVSLSFGLGRDWYRTPTGHFQATRLSFGVSVDGLFSSRENQSRVARKDD